MDELRLNGTEGDHLVLEAQDGQRFKLLIDETLKGTVRGHASFDKSAVTLTPREIQAEIRAGATVEELAGRWHDPIEYVAKFAQPILDELAHIVSAAQSVNISIAGDRYNDVSSIEFGEIIASRLEASGARAIAWNAARDETNTWRVSVSYSLSGEEGTAVWSFDPRKLILAPENQNAIALSTQNSLAAPTATKLSAVEPPQFDTQSLEDTVRVETVIPLGRTSEQLVTSSDEPQDDLATTSDLLDALKRKRAGREHPSTLVDSNVDSPTEPVVQLSVVEETIEVVDAIGEESQEEPEPRPAPTRRSGRPGIPSFDEIIQGTKSESDDE